MSSSSVSQEPASPSSESVGKEEKLLCQQEIGYPEIPMVELQAKSKKTNVNKWTLHLCQEQIAASTAAASDLSVHEDPLAANYGDIPLVELQSKTIVDVNEWTPVENLDHSFANQPVKIRGRVHSKPLTTNNMTFLVIKEFDFMVRCLVQEQPDSVSFQMVKYAAELIPESIVDVEGVVFIREYAQQVEIQVRKLHCVSRATSNLPINLKDAAVETEKSIQAAADKRVIHVSPCQPYLEIPTYQGILRLQNHVEQAFTKFLWAENFTQIHSPKSMAVYSEDQASATLIGVSATLAQAPQLYRQMLLCGDFRRVFEIGPIFGVEDFVTHNHMWEFTGLDVEMEIKMHYFEVMDIVDRLFVAMFDSLNRNCKKDLEIVGNQYPFKPLKYLRNTPRLTYEECIKMLKEVGVEIERFGDLNSLAKRTLSNLVFEKYDTEFYILHQYPLAKMPFYTMPCHDKPEYSNSFTVFIRDEEIISGAQRIHEPNLLEQRAHACGINIETVSTYLDSFRHGAPLYGGFGANLERVVMLFCGLIDNGSPYSFDVDCHPI